MLARSDIACFTARLIVFALASAKCSSTATPPRTDAPCPSGWKKSSTAYCYKVFDGRGMKKTYHAAKSQCERLGAELLSEMDVQDEPFTDTESGRTIPAKPEQLERDKTTPEKVTNTNDLRQRPATRHLSKTTCHSFASPMCSNIGYNMTSLPNSLGHGSVDSALQEMNQFHPLIKVGCSSQLEPFLCSLYIPPCQEIGGVVPPCRSLCLQARSGCEQLMQRFGYTWPSSMACDRFPENGFCLHPGKL
ncbi:frizzled-like protein [Elysia marginata]|uniref:Frizzled-like protein n=1 Tax=Elysia marginata TaxID=1093978 RepID=A0AAV4GEZ6_9GAST|nr:frizzled-like protein [Elysia marginata]